MEDSKEIQIYGKEITIIGSGPTGLTLALILRYYGAHVTILEREATPGGCHRVSRVDGRFTEHGPRIYTSGSKTFHHMLEKAGLEPMKYFTPYKSQVSEPLKQSIKYFTASDIFSVVSAYSKFLVNKNHGDDLTVTQLNLSPTAAEYVDKMCRLTDGAGADRYTLNSFIRLIDQKFTETVNQPLYANDKGWVRDLVKQLQSRDVAFKFNQEVSSINGDGKRRYVIHTKDGDTYESDMVIFATPTDTIEKILSQSAGLEHVFGPIDKIKQFNKHCLYEVYLSITLHWNKRVKLPEIWGNGTGNWNIAWINLTDYMITESGTVISACITKTNSPAENGKTANDCSENELKQEVLRQLQANGLIDNVPLPDAVILSPEIYREAGAWRTRDNAYMRTTYKGAGPSDPVDKNHQIFSVGCHNEHNSYKFTSVESAVQNAYYWAHTHIAGAGADKQFPILEGYTLSFILKWVLALFGVLFVVSKLRKIKEKI
jgi:predicted NAD/FAD-dependent oxidoreductase